MGYYSVIFENVLKCRDINECERNIASCSTKAECRNTPGSYDCHCHEDYEGDGHTCSYITVCHPNPCGPFEHCRRKGLDPECFCYPGYEPIGQVSHDSFRLSHTMTYCGVHLKVMKVKVASTSTNASMAITFVLSTVHALITMAVILVNVIMDMKVMVELNVIM